MSDYSAAPCANSDDRDAWFVNKNGALDPEDRAEIEALWAARAQVMIDDMVPPGSMEEITRNCTRSAAEEIAELEQANRRRLRDAIRSCYFDCPMALRLQCLHEGLEEPYGIRGAYTEQERRQMVRVRDEHKISGRRVVDIAISVDRAAALSGGGDPVGDQSPGQPQPHDHQHTEEAL